MNYVRSRDAHKQLSRTSLKQLEASSGSHKSHQANTETCQKDVNCHNVLNSFVHASIIYAVSYVIGYSVRQL